MSDLARHDALIARLTAGLQPVRHLPSPWRRALMWLAAVGALGLALSQVAGPDLATRLAAADLGWPALGAALTAILAAISAMQISLPDRGTLWAALPLPGLMLWLGTASPGCLEAFSPGALTGTLADAWQCLSFMLGVSLPLSALLVLLLRWACPLRPNLAACLGGIAVAGAAACLLALFHTTQITLLDIVTHISAVGLVIGLNGIFGGRLLGRA